MPNIFTKIKKRILGDTSESIEELRARGVRIGLNVHLFNVNIDKSHGFLVEIGDNVTLTNMVILAHDASTKMYLGYTKVGRVKIGNNVFAGYNSVILPGVKIGNDVIIGAGCVVAKDIPDDSVVVGNPAKIIAKTSEYIAKNKAKLEDGVTPIFDTPWREKTSAQKDEMIQALQSGIGFDK